MRTIKTTVGPLTATTANSIATSQSGTANTALTLTSSPYVLATPQQISITSAGNDSGINWTVVGTTWNGDANTEIIAGSNVAVFSLSDFATVISITPSGNTASTVTAGVTQSGGSTWVACDEWALPAISIQCDVTGTVSYSVQTTIQDTSSTIFPYQINWYTTPSGISASSTSAETFMNFVPKFVRLFLASGSGSVTMRVTQSGNVMF